MFDVDWSDPNRESVGARRARKQKEKGKDKESDNGESVRRHNSNDNDKDSDLKRDDQGQDSNRTSGSVRSSVSSTDKQFGFFGGKHRKKGSSSRKASAKSGPSSSLRSPTIEEGPHDGPVSGSQQTGMVGVEESPGLPSKRFSSFADSVFSKLDESERAPGGSLFGIDITNPQPGFMSSFQELGDGCSMITKATEVTIRERTAEDSDFLVSQVQISAGDDDHRPASKPSSSKSSDPPTRFSEVVHLPPAMEASLQQGQNGDNSHPLPPIVESSDAKDVEDGLPKQKSIRPARPKLTAPPIGPAAARPTDKAGAWKAPEDWAISPTESAVSGPPADDPQNTAANNHHAPATLDIARVQRETELMLQASPQVVLLRLKGMLGDYDPTLVQKPDGSHDRRDETQHASDAAMVYKEREMERKRWLLTALYNMETIWAPDDKLSKPAAKPSVQRVLALFESQATASYLAGINISVPVYHLSPEPLAHKEYPNLHPIACSTTSVSALAQASGAFTSVSCLPMTSALPSAEIPSLLRAVHRALAPGGYLHLVVIDPHPAAASAGPLLQRWIDDSLVFNLELRFRGSHPGRNFPVWLDEAGLRGRGSLVTSTRFMAVTPERRNADDERAAVKKELRTIVGRLLWQEIWGGFVTGDSWWWEVPEIVDECAQRKTYWEYSIIAACKDSGG